MRGQPDGKINFHAQLNTAEKETTPNVGYSVDSSKILSENLFLSTQRSSQKRRCMAPSFLAALLLTNDFFPYICYLLYQIRTYICDADKFNKT